MMDIGFRWYGAEDQIPLEYIRQIPAVQSIVSAVYDVPVGEIWPEEKIARLKGSIVKQGLSLSVIESIPVHEDIKLGKPARDQWIANYQQSIRHLGQQGIPILCYNFMPVFDWTRTNLNKILPDGSSALSYDTEELKKIDIRRDSLSLPGWGTQYEQKELIALLDAYAELTEDDLWDNLGYFLHKVVPVAEESGVLMAIHPDDPPWPIFGLPRIITNEKNIERLLNVADSRANGVTFCTGSLGPNKEMDLLHALQKFVGRDRVHFVHMRNIKRTQDDSFHEVEHLSQAGNVDMFQIMKILVQGGFSGVIRPDHGRMIWGEQGKPGYGLYDRALGAMYIAGLHEAAENCFR